MKQTLHTTVFLIDDNEIDNFVHKRVLKNFSNSIEVLIFSSGSDALEHLRKKRISPQFIFLNLHLPVNDGLEFLDIFEKMDIEKKQTSIYILSTMLFPCDMENLLNNSNYSGYIQKPLTAEKLISVLGENR